MTRAQYRKKISVARRFGEVKIDEVTILRFSGRSFIHGEEWSLRHVNGNVIDTSYDPMKFDYICD